MRQTKEIILRSLLILFFSLFFGNYVFSQGPNSGQQQAPLIPDGFVETKDLVFFEIDKHGSKGSVESVIANYNKHIVGKFDGITKEAKTKEDLIDQKGNPFDWKLRMDIIHPIKPSKPRPVFFIIATASQRNIPRHTPFQQIFAKRGYVTVIIDHAYSPLGRLFPHNVSTYTLEDRTGVKAYTAAIRYLRANADKYSIDTNKIGGFGHSKGSYGIGRLADPNINHESEERFEKKRQEPYGPQPNLGFRSNIQVGFQSMGNGTRRSKDLVKDNYAPMVTAVGKLDKANHWDVWPDVVAAYSIDHDANWLGIPMEDRGHQMAIGFQPDLGYIREEAIEKFFAAYLEPNLPPNVLYVAPYDGKNSENIVRSNSPVIIHFAPQMDVYTVKKAVKVIDVDTNKEVPGNWKVSRKDTYFQFTPNVSFTKNKTYKVYIDTGAKSSKKISMVKPYEHLFKVNVEQ